jgi:hypothetical protein
MDNFKDMSVKNKYNKQLPKYSRTTEEIIPFLDAWLGQDERFIRKVKKNEGGSRQTLFYHGPD